MVLNTIYGINTITIPSFVTLYEPPEGNSVIQSERELEIIVGARSADGAVDVSGRDVRVENEPVVSSISEPVVSSRSENKGNSVEENKPQPRSLC